MQLHLGMLNHVEHKAKFISCTELFEPKLLALEIFTDSHTVIETVATVARGPKFQVFQHFYSAT